MNARDTDRNTDLKQVLNFLSAKLIELFWQSQVELKLLLRREKCVRLIPAPYLRQRWLQEAQRWLQRDVTHAGVENTP